MVFSRDLMFTHLSPMKIIDLCYTQIKQYRMKNLLLLIISVLFSLSTFAQELQTYNGKFKGGNANYQYKTATDGSRIYHGTFEFTKEFALDSRSYTFSIKGSYKDDQKHGRWVYNEIPTPNKRMPEDYYRKIVTIPTFVNEYGKVHSSMERLIHSRISLTIDYIDGKMEGDYIHTIHTPPISNYKETKDILHLKMKNNRVVSNYTSAENDSYVANIEFDDYGFPHGEWTYRDKSSEDIIDYIYIFNHGIAMKEIIRNESTGDTSQKNYEMNNESTQEYKDYLENNSQIFYLKTYEAPITIKNKLFSFILLRIYDDLFRYSIRTSDFKGEYPFEGFPYKVSSTISSHPGLSGKRRDISSHLGLFSAEKSASITQHGKTSGIGGWGSYDLGGRSLGSGGLVKPNYSVDDYGTVVVDILVNPKGDVVEATIGKGTNTPNTNLRNEAIRAAKQTKFNKVLSVTNQKGTITYKVNLN